MKFDGFQQVQLQYVYSMPGYTMQGIGFAQSSLYEPIFGYSSMRISGDGVGGRVSNNLVQCCIYAFRPAGIVQILLNQNIGPVNGNTLSANAGVGGMNLLMTQVNNNAAGTKNGVGELYIPEAPGIYSPEWRTGYATVGATLWAHGIGPLLIPNSLTGKFPPWGSTVYPSQLCAGSGIVLEFSGFLKHWAEGTLMTGAVVFTSTFNSATQLNYTLINGTNTAGLKLIAWNALAATGPAPNLIPITLPDFPTLNPNGLVAGQVYSWHGGFILCFLTNGAGPTGQCFEIIVTDHACTRYKILRFVPKDATTQAMLTKTTNAPAWQVVIDKYGILWLYAGSSDINLNNKIFTSFMPMGWMLPQITYVPRAAVSLPCYSTCNEVSPQI